MQVYSYQKNRSPFSLIIVIVALCIIAFLLSRCVGCGTQAANVNTSNNEALEVTNDTASNAEKSASSNASSNNSTESTTKSNYDYSDRVEELLQFPEMEGGCEIVSLTCMLNAMGYDTDMHNIAKNYVEYSEDGGYVYGYSGDPYSNGGGFPPALTNAGNAYLWDQDSNVWFKDLTGTSLSGLSYWLDKNVPVLVWSTMYLGEPMHTGVEEDGYEWYDNEHCVLVYGMDDENVYVMDPMIGFVTRDRDYFEYVYDDCGKMAVSLDI